MSFEIIFSLFRNLFNNPMTVCFPSESIEIPENYRGEHFYDRNKCISCGLCAKICPDRAIEMIEAPGEYKEQYPKKYPKIDLGKCCFCGFCEDICPQDCIKLTNHFFLSTFDKNTVIKRPFSDNEKGKVNNIA
jgi:NADH-quinone oxidoreductase chain I